MLHLQLACCRNPFLGKYKAGFTKDGIIKALDVDLYSNAGFTLDLTFSVVQRAMFHVDNCYYIENINTRGHCCKTNIQSNTAFRGFGGPQGMFVTEHCIEEVNYFRFNAHLDKGVAVTKILAYF